MTHYFHNPGALNTLFLHQFGLSVKDEGAIGQFGTGLKYATAIIVRGGGRITIHTEGRTLRIGSRVETVRGQSHSIVTLTKDGETKDLPFTTSLGKNWKPWMAFRELLCNAWDESGGYVTSDRDIPGDYQTVIAVDWPEFDAINLADYFILDEPDLANVFFDNEEVRLVKNTEANHIFYKGVRVGSMEKLPMQIHLKAERWRSALTEDRTLTWEYRAPNTAIRELYDEKTQDKALAFWKASIKAEFPGIIYLSNPPDRFMETFTRAYNNGSCRHECLRKFITDWEQAKPPKESDPTPAQRQALDKAIAILAKGGINLDDYTIRVRSRKVRNVMGEAHMGTDKIYVTEEAFKRGLRMVIMVLLEEYCHHNYRVSDETREMQDALQEMWLITFCELTGQVI